MVRGLRARGRMPRDLAVRAKVVRAERELVLELTLRFPEHEARRVLRAASCSELVDALVWLAAVGDDTGAVPPAVGGSAGTARVDADPRIAQPPQRPAATPSGASEAATSSSDTADAAREAPQSAGEAPDQRTVPAIQASRAHEAARPDDAHARSRADRWLRATVGAGVWSLRLPRPQALLQAGVGVGLGRPYFELRYAHLFAQSAQFSRAGSMRVHADAVSALGCALFRLPRVGLRGGPCVQLIGMRSVAAAQGITRPERAAYRWLLAGPALQLALSLPYTLALVLEGALGMPLTARPRLRIEGLGEIARASIVSAHGTLGLGTHW